MNQEKLTPLMSQYFEIKKQYKDELVLFQVGDFYELFFEDAQKAAAALSITLTKRGTTADGEPIPLCGVPVQSLDHYVGKLVKNGFCVVLCDQLEPAVQGKIVKRGVRQVLTPGTLTDTRLLDEKSASYLCSFFEHERGWGLVFAEILTAQCYATLIPVNAFKTLESELTRFFPDEIVLDEACSSYAQFNTYFKKQGYFTRTVAERMHEKQITELVHQKIAASHGQGAAHVQEEGIVQALTLLCAYLKKNNEGALQALQTIYFYQPDDFMVIDNATQKNLELMVNTQDGERVNSLLATLDTTVTSMGARALKKWLVRPLVNNTIITARMDAVAYFKNDYALMEQVRIVLKEIGDGERIVGRIALDRATVHDYVQLLCILQVIPKIKKMLYQTVSLLHMLQQSCNPCESLHVLLAAALSDDGITLIKKGFDATLDNVRLLVNESHTALLALEKQEQEATGIGSLKIRYTDAFGYAIEITNTHKNNIPSHYIRKQTLVGRERYTCAALQELEQKIMHARSESIRMEQELFQKIKQAVIPYVHDLRKMMHALSHIDVLSSFALCAYERGYIRPVMHDSRDILIEGGKHPVVEQKVGSFFVPNDTILTEESSLWIITGPNMGGKSTYLRQVALLCIMAQCGSFVPAKSAQLPLIDRVFTRIGASDNVAEGKSTFLVEMEEVAHICLYATAKSLVILDEVGRGTSTYDGVSIAHAIIEYVYQTIKARCLFATHYHELTVLPTQFSGMHNRYTASKQTENGIVFLHKLVPGIAQGSFGLEVAKLAHIPDTIIQRARDIEKKLIKNTEQLQSESIEECNMQIGEKSETCKDSIKKGTDFIENNQQDKIQQLELQLAVLQKQIDCVKEVSLEDLSPKKAFDLVWKMKETLHP